MTAMDVVVPCDCGSRFSFQVEPVNERLPEGAELLCPTCGKDGVPLANRVIGESLRKAEREERARQAAQPQKKSWLKREKKPEQPKQPDPFSYPVNDPFENARKGSDDFYAGPNKLRGTFGAALGGLIGAATWAGAVYWTGYEIRYVAVAVGALAGLGSRTIGGGRDYHLGLFASACALLAILVGQFFAAQIYLTKTLSVELAEMEYTFQVEQAKEAATLKTEEDFKEFIAAARSVNFKPVPPESITSKAVLEFQATELPKLRKLAAGEVSKSAFVEQERNAFLSKLTVKEIFNASITPYLFLWVFVGVGAAWKLASDYGTSVE